MLTVNTAAGHRGPALVGHGVLKANGGEGREREQEGRKWKVKLEGKGLLWSDIEHGRGRRNVRKGRRLLLSRPTEKGGRGSEKFLWSNMSLQRSRKG